MVGAEDADEVDFDTDSTPMRRRKQFVSDRIRISREEKTIYDMVDGTMSVRDVLELSKFSEFDTAKALYELLTRDLIEEVRGSAAAAVLAQVTPLDETEVAEGIEPVGIGARRRTESGLALRPRPSAKPSNRPVAFEVRPAGYRKAPQFRSLGGSSRSTFDCESRDRFRPEVAVLFVRA